MDLKLRGKRALVTGSTAGIGFAIARGLARERAEVIVNGRSEQKIAEAIQRISSEVGSTASGIAADLSSAEGVNRLIEGAGRVDILVNNAGIFDPVPFTEISDQDWFRFFELNVMSGVQAGALAAAADAPAQLGPHHLHLERVRRADPGGDGALRGDQDGAARALARHRRERGGHRSDGERRPAGTDPVGGGRRLSGQGRRRAQDRERRRSRKSSCAPCGPHR